MKPETFCPMIPRIKYIVDIDFDPNAVVTEEFKEKMKDMVGSNPVVLNLIRGAFFRVMVPYILFQTRYWFSGLPGSGKSTLLDLFQFVARKDSVMSISNQGVNKFSMFSLKNKKLVTCTETLYLSETMSNLILTFHGDSIPYELKHKNVSGTFRLSGIFMGVSNQSFHQVLSSSKRMTRFERAT